MLRRQFASAAVAFVLLLSSNGRSAEDLGYDPKADPFAQLAQGVALAKAQDKLVLLISGGDWCVWCHYLNAFVKGNADVERQLYDTFVVVKVYVGDENKNERFFSNWPEAAGAPHFWVFSTDGNLLSSQPTLVLEDGDKSYDKQKVLDFIGRWKNRA
jgi:thioredoxin-related protein